jgi:hypothetical protein
MSAQIQVIISARGQETVRSAMQTVQQSGQAASGALANAFGSKVTTPLQNFTKTTQTLPKVMSGVDTAAKNTTASLDGLGKGTDVAQGKMAKFGQAFSSNKGLIFGMAGLSSAMGEAIGMMGMYGDASAGMKEAQTKVNELVAEGKEGSAEYNQAIQEQTKAQKWLSMATRNTMLSMMDNVFFSTMVISALTKQVSEGGKLSGVIEKLKGAFTGLTGSQKAVTTATKVGLDAVSGMTTGLQGMDASMKTTQVSTMGLVTSLAALAAGIGTALLIIQLVQQAQDALEKAGTKLSKPSTGQLFQSPEERMKGWVEMQAVIEGTGLSLLDFETNPAKVTDTLIRLGRVNKETGEIITKDFQGPVDKAAQQTAAYASTLMEAGVPLDALREKMLLQGGSTESINAVMKEGAAVTKQHMSATLDSMIATGKFGEVSEVTKDQMLQQNMAGIAANTIINKYKQAVQSGILPVSQLGKVVEEETKGMLSGKEITEEMVPLVNEYAEAYLTKLAPGADKSAKAIKALAKEDAEYMKRVDESVKLLAQRDAENIEMIALQDTISAAVGKTIDLQDANIDVLKHMGDTINTVNSQVQNEELALFDLAAQYDVLTPKIYDWTVSLDDNREVMMNTIAGSIDYTRALTDQDMMLRLVAQGNLSAVVSMDQYLQTLVAGRAEQDKTHLILTKMATSFGITLPKGITFSNEQLKTFITTMQMGGNWAASLADVMEARLAPALQRFGSLIGAESNKDFGKAWKDIDFGSIPKGVRGDFKDMFKEMRNAGELGREVSTALDMVFTAVATGSKKVENSDIRKVFKEVNDDLERMGKINKNVKPIQNIFEPFEKLKGGKLKQEIGMLGDTIAELTKRNEDNWISWDDSRAIISQYVLDLQHAGKSNEDIKKRLDEAGISLEDYGLKMEDIKEPTDEGSGSVDQFGKSAVSARADIDMVTGAVELLGQYMNALPPLAIDNGQAIQMIQQVQKLWTNTQKIVPKLTVVNKQAIQLINQVQKLWTNTAKIKPTLVVQTQKALKAVGVVAQRIMDLEKLHPTVTVTVKVKEQKIPAQHGLHTKLSKDTLILAHAGERVDIGRGQHQAHEASDTVNTPAVSTTANFAQGPKQDFHATFIIPLPWGDIVKHVDFELGQSMRKFRP